MKNVLQPTRALEEKFIDKMLLVGGISFFFTRPFAALWAAGLGWIVADDSSGEDIDGRVHFEVFSTSSTSLKNHGNQPKTMKNPETTLKNVTSPTQGPN